MSKNSRLPRKLNTDIKELSNFFYLKSMGNGDCGIHSFLEATFEEYKNASSDNERDIMCTQFKNELAEKLIEKVPNSNISYFEKITDKSPNLQPEKDSHPDYAEGFYSNFRDSFRNQRFKGFIHIKYMSDLFDYAIYIINKDGLIQNENEERDPIIYCVSKQDMDDMKQKKKSIIFLYHDKTHYDTVCYKRDNKFYTVFDSDSDPIRVIQNLYSISCKIKKEVSDTEKSD